MSFAFHAYPNEAIVFTGSAGDRSAGALGAFAATIAARLPVGRPVVIACADRYAFTASLLAAWSRRLPIHLPPNVQPETVTRLESELGATILHDRPEATGLDVRPLEPTGAGRPLPPPPSDEAPVVVYTSGSQGRPIGHAKAPSQLLREAETLVRGFGLAGTTFVSSVPAHHIYGLLFGVLAPLFAGGRIGRATPLFPDDVVKTLRASGAKVWVTVPPHLKAFADGDPKPLAALTRVFSSGAPVPEVVARRLCDAGVNVTQVFGSTETGGIAFREGTASTWQPLWGVTIDVSSDGLLRVDSPWLAPNEARPVTTQDRVRRDGGGFVHEGRADSVVKVGGRRVDLGDIEARLRAIAGVREARVLAEPHPGAHGVEILAVVETADPGLTPAKLRAELGRGLDAVSMPRRIRCVDKLPLGAAGKVSRAALLALFSLDWTIAPRPIGEGRWSFTPTARLGYFKGHFPQHPVLPAVVQLQRLALALARAQWADLGPLIRLSRVKFRKLVGPGEELTIALERPRADLVKFTMTAAEDQPVSSGNLVFGGTGA
jgi:AMP-binding enzyme/AMP-binding enzyme C-terminal domain